MPGAGTGWRGRLLGWRLAALLAALSSVLAVAAGARTTSVPEAGATRTAETSPQTNPRPRIGLALGGGGARGLAHIGVLEYLQDHRIPVDAIAGTSMGALVGGAIAAGTHVDSLRALVIGADWQQLLASSPTYANLAYRRKEDARGFPVEIEIGLRGGPRLPTGLNPGPHVLTLLSKLALAHSDLDSFASLPIPFRCVATDLAAAAPFVLDRGSLPLALRASMAIPGVFEPVWIDRRLLADGGLVDNVPVDVVRDMGVDFVVAVDVYSARADTFPETLLQVLGRAMEIQVQENARREVERADVVVRVDTIGLRTTDYAAGALIIATGYAAAARTPGLLDHALDPAAWGEYRDALEARRRRVPLVPQFVRVEGVPRRDAKRFEHGLQHHVGVPVDASLLEQDIDRLVGGGPYTSASFERTVVDGGTGLLVRVHPQPHAPPTARFLLDANNDYEDLNLTLGSRITFQGATTASSEVRVDVALGAAPRFVAELFQPLGWGAALSPSGLFLAPYGFIRRDREDFYTGDQLVSSTRWTRTGAGADLGWILSTRTRVRAGYATSHADEDLWIGSPSTPVVAGREQQGRIEVNADFLDAATIPRSGGYVDAEARWYLDAPGVDGGFGRCEGRLGAAIPSRRHDRTLIGVAGGASFGGAEPTPAYRFALGGPLKLDAFHTDERRGQHFALARASHLVGLFRLGVLSDAWLYGVATAEIGSAFDIPEAARGLVSGSLGFAADTPIGPCTLGASLGTGGRWRIHFTAGMPLR